MITAGSATPAWGSQSLTLQRQSIGGHRPGGGGPATVVLPQHWHRHCALHPPALCKCSRPSAPEATAELSGVSTNPAKIPSCLETQHHPLPSQRWEQLRPAQAPSQHPTRHRGPGQAHCHTLCTKGSPACAVEPRVGASTQNSAQGQLDPHHLRTNRRSTKLCMPSSASHHHRLWKMLSLEEMQG